VQRFASIAALTAMLLTAAACGSDRADTLTAPSSTGAPAATGTSDTSAPDTSAPDTTATTVDPKLPKAIISLSPSGTEMLFAIGAGPQVLAIDDQSTYPAEALAKEHDLSGFEPNVEAIAKLKPDLVILSDTKIQEQLTSLGIKVWVGAAATSFDDVFTQIEQLGAATGHVGAAAELVSKMQAEIKAAVANVRPPTKPLSVYHELDNTFYSVTSNTFIGKVYSLFGLKNIADGAQPGNDYPQLNAEYIVKADPDLVVLADGKCCAQTADVVGARPGWASIKAVQHKGVIVIDDDIASRWGPRIVDLVQAVADALAKVPAA
jgi:iron complex transport system substrate-binding protein